MEISNRSFDDVRPGAAAGSAVARVAGDEDAVVSELLEAQSRLRKLLAVNQSLAGSSSASQVAQQLVEAACATAGARYARLELHETNGSAAHVLEHATEPDRIPGYRVHLEQRRQQGSSGEQRGCRSEEGRPELSGLTVALNSAGQHLGTLHVLDPSRGGPFTPLSEELLNTLAGTAAIILDRASHHEQAQRRTVWLEATRRVEELVIASDDDELTVWREIATSLHTLTSSSTVALQIPADDENMHVLIAAGNNAETMTGRHYPKEESLGWVAMQEGHGQLLTSGSELPRRHHSLADPQQVGAAMSVPLLGDSGPRGAVTLVRGPGQPPFSHGDLELVEDFARKATVALELAEARSARYRLGHAETQEAIARNLHDHVIQRLFATGLSLQAAANAELATMQRHLRQAVQDLDATIHQIRETIFTLRQPRTEVIIYRRNDPA
jgi:GAF domain-containing protein